MVVFLHLLSQAAGLLAKLLADSYVGRIVSLLLGISFLWCAHNVHRSAQDWAMGVNTLGKRPASHRAGAMALGPANSSLELSPEHKLKEVFSPTRRA